VGHPSLQIRRTLKDTGSRLSLLTDVDSKEATDSRTQFLVDLADGQPWLDPKYQELGPLFKQMASQLDGDLYWAKYCDDEEMKKPDFLHEALQRIIFNFLLEHREKQFMKLDEDTCNRKVEPAIRRHAEGESAAEKRSFSTMAGESEPEGVMVSHLSSPALLRTTYSCSRRSALEKNEPQWVLTVMVNLLVGRRVG
jgi:hypothetical protein